MSSKRVRETVQKKEILIDCHMCWIPQKSSQTAVCSKRSCKKAFCQKCIQNNYDKDFKVAINYKSDFFICYVCQTRCKCDFCTGKIPMQFKNRFINHQVKNVNVVKQTRKTQSKANIVNKTQKQYQFTDEEEEEEEDDYDYDYDEEDEEQEIEYEEEDDEGEIECEDDDDYDDDEFHNHDEDEEYENEDIDVDVEEEEEYQEEDDKNYEKDNEDLPELAVKRNKEKREFLRVVNQNSIKYNGDESSTQDSFNNNLKSNFGSDDMNKCQLVSLVQQEQGVCQNSSTTSRSVIQKQQQQQQPNLQKYTLHRILGDAINSSYQCQFNDENAPISNNNHLQKQVQQQYISNIEYNNQQNSFKQINNRVPSYYDNIKFEDDCFEIEKSVFSQVKFEKQKSIEKQDHVVEYSDDSEEEVVCRQIIRFQPKIKQILKNKDKNKGYNNKNKIHFANIVKQMH